MWPKGHQDVPRDYCLPPLTYSIYTGTACHVLMFMLSPSVDVDAAHLFPDSVYRCCVWMLAEQW